AAALTAPSLARAQFTWTNPAGGNWNVAGNWTPGVPTPGATTSLAFGTGATVTSTYTATNDIGAAGTAFELNSCTFNNTAGTVTISGGSTVNVTENMYVGDVAGSTGTLTVTGPGTVVNLIGGASTRLGVGNFGNGTLNITAGGVINVQRVFTPRQAGATSA